MGTHFLTLTVLFFLCFACSFSFLFFCIAIIMNLMSSTWNATLFAITQCASTFAYWNFFTLLLAILVFRLHVTFSQTQLRMSSTKYWLFAVILVLLFVLPVVLIILTIVVSANTEEEIQSIAVDYPWYLPLVLALVLVFFVLFFIGSIFAVHLFVSKLHQLAEAQAGTPRVKESTKNGDSLPSLNRRQQKFIDLAARYMLLFAIATISSFFFGEICVKAFGWKSGIRNVFFAVDYTVNIICVYLQFGFAGEHYRKCCGPLDACCRKKLSKRAMNSAHTRLQSGSSFTYPQNEEKPKESADL